MLTRLRFDGKSLGEPYDAPQHKGPLPTAEIEGGKLYTGSCHCGALTVAAKLKPLDETFPDALLICNCSSCERVSVPAPLPPPLSTGPPQH